MNMINFKNTKFSCYQKKNIMHRLCEVDCKQPENYLKCKIFLEHMFRTNLKNSAEFEEEFPHLNIAEARKYWNELKVIQGMRHSWTQQQRLSLFYSFLRHHAKWREMNLDFPHRTHLSIRQRFMGSFFNKNLQKNMIYFKLLVFDHVIINFGGRDSPGLIPEMLQVIYKEQDILFQVVLNFLLGVNKNDADAHLIIEVLFGIEQVKYFRSSASHFDLNFIRFINFARANLSQALKLIPNMNYTTVCLRGMDMLNPKFVEYNPSKSSRRERVGQSPKKLEDAPHPTNNLGRSSHAQRRQSRVTKEDSNSQLNNFDSPQISETAPAKLGHVVKRVDGDRIETGELGAEDISLDPSSQSIQNQNEGTPLKMEASNLSQGWTDLDTIARMGSELASKMFQHSEIGSPTKSIKSESSHEESASGQKESPKPGKSDSGGAPNTARANWSTGNRKIWSK